MTERRQRDEDEAQDVERPETGTRPGEPMGTTAAGSAGLGDTDAADAYGGAIEAARRRPPSEPEPPDRRRPGTDELIGGPEDRPPGSAG